MSSRLRQLPVQSSPLSSPPPKKQKTETSEDEFLTSFRKEHKKITWKLENVLDLLDTGEEPEIQFKMGGTIDMPSCWKVVLNLNKIPAPPADLTTSGTGQDAGAASTGSGIALYMSLVKYDGASKKLYVKFCTQISNPIPDVKNPFIFRGIGKIHDFKKPIKFGYKNCLNLDTLRTLQSSLSPPAELAISIKLIFTLYSHQCENNGLDEQNLAKESQALIYNNFGQLLESGKNSDFVIRVKKTFDSDSVEYVEVKAHKAILASQSIVFYAMLETQMDESRRDAVTIEDLTLKGLKVLLSYIYTGKVDNDWKHVWEEVVNAADKYNLPLLLSFLDAQLHTVAENGNAVELYRVAKRHGLEIATKKLLAYIKSNVEDVLNDIL